MPMLRVAAREFRFADALVGDVLRNVAVRVPAHA